MRPRDDKKRQAILKTAAHLFSTQPFHKVKLDEVAAAAKVGKGTLYIYFSSKEDLYFTLLYEGFSQLVDGLSAQLGSDPSDAHTRLRQIVVALISFGMAHPEMFEIMRTATPIPLGAPHWDQKRRQLHELVVATLNAGITSGEFGDTHPQLTALYIPGIVRSAMLFGPRDINRDELIDHVMGVLLRGIARN